MKKYFKLMRLKHYLKNALILFPLFFNGSILSDGGVLKTAILGFAAFCFLSSSIYIINDIQDIEKDRRHPVKRLRPLASGEVSIKKAICVLVICIGLSIIFQCLTNKINGIFYLVMYFVLNILYSMGLKNKPLVDVVILVSGFLIRLLYGACITDVVISGWLYLTVISVAFFMGLGKRRNEFVRYSESDTRQVLSRYSKDFLDKNMYMCMALINVFYALWAMESEMLWTVPLVMVICMRYSMDVEGDSEGDPVDVILKDKWLLGLGIVYAVSIAFVLYIRR